MNRRHWLACTGATLLGGARSAKASVTPAEFKQRLEGPILSVPTPYTADFRIDGEGFRNIVNTGMKAGCRVVALTNGNSQYDRLTFDEIKQLTKIMVDSTGGRALTIAATGQWWTGQVVTYAKYAESLGADAVQVFVPVFADPETLYQHFRAIAAATRLAIVLHGQVPVPQLKRLLEIDSIVAIKEEYPLEYSTEVFALYGKRLNIFAGGTKSRFLVYQPSGMKAYYSTFSTFAPEIARRFWESCRKGDFAAARDITVRYDIPFFQKFSNPLWRATLEYFGIARRYLRPPERTFSEQEVRDLKPFYRSLGL